VNHDHLGDMTRLQTLLLTAQHPTLSRRIGRFIGRLILKAMSF